jgi:hypothetical protein
MLWILPEQEIGHAGVHLLDSGRAQECHRLDVAPLWGQCLGGQARHRDECVRGDTGHSACPVPCYFLVL